MIPVWFHLFPFRTEKLNIPGPKIFKLVFEKIGRRRGKTNKLNDFPIYILIMKNGRFHKNDLRQKFVTCVRYGPSRGVRASVIRGSPRFLGKFRWQSLSPARRWRKSRERKGQLMPNSCTGPKCTTSLHNPLLFANPIYIINYYRLIVKLLNPVFVAKSLLIYPKFTIMPISISLKEVQVFS